MTHAMSQKTAASSVAGVAMLAALTGAVAALLLAPKSGSETRGNIRRKMLEAQERSKQKAAEMKNLASSRMDEMRGKSERAAAGVRSVASEARRQVEDAATDTQTRGRRRGA